MNQQKKTVKLAKMGMLAAISVILVYLIRIPFPGLPFLEYDLADTPILLGAFSFGPIAGVGLTLIAAIIQGVTVSSASGIYGIIMHVLATATFVLVASLIYGKQKTRKRAVIGIVCGAIAMTVIMFFANLVVTPIFMGIPVEAILKLMPGILIFNLTKAGFNGLITFFVYKRISGFLHK